MSREILINKLRSELDYVNRQLVRSYSAKNLVYFLSLEKEVQIQSSYLKLERTYE